MRDMRVALPYLKNLVGLLEGFEGTITHGLTCVRTWQAVKHAVERFDPGDLVLTLQDAGAKDWMSEARKHCHWRVLGKVLQVQTGHGLTYEVSHISDPFKSTAWYEHDELTKLKGGT